MALTPQVFARLKSQLLNTGLSQKDQPLFQVINQLIDNLQATANEVSAVTSGSSGGLGGATFYTKDEEGGLPNSSQLLPGQGIEFLHAPSGRTVIHTALPFLPGSGEDGEPGFIGPPGVQGPQGVAGVAGSAASVPYWFEEHTDYTDIYPLFSLYNPGLIPEFALRDDNLLARIAANEIITGNWDFTGNPIRIVRASPGFTLRDTGAAVDEGNWIFTNVGGIFSFTAFNDALSVGSNALIFTRSGTSITSARIQTGAGTLRTIWDTNGVLDHRFALMLSGQQSVSLTADQTAWNPTGLGTKFYFAVTPTAGWIIKGITAQGTGTLITIVNMGASSIQFNHEDAAASAANRIYAPLASNFTISQYQVVTFYYDSIISRWMKFSWS